MSNLKTAHVVSFHPDADSPNGVGGWDWYHFRSAAIRRVTELVAEGGYAVMYKTIKVKFDPSDEDQDIADLIEDSGQLDEIY